MNKILITIKGRTLILYFNVRQGAINTPPYIEVLPSDELAQFDLKGLTPEMFCVNIADMVNFRGQYSGRVENEKQFPVARWSMNRDEYLELIRHPAIRLSHVQVNNALSALPGYAGTADNQYIDFIETIAATPDNDQQIHYGYRLTIVTEEHAGDTRQHAYFMLGTRKAAEWLDDLPPHAYRQTIRQMVEHKLQQIRQAGIPLAEVNDETDYAQEPHGNPASP